MDLITITEFEYDSTLPQYENTSVYSSSFADFELQVKVCRGRRVLESDFSLGYGPLCHITERSLQRIEGTITRRISKASQVSRYISNLYAPVNLQICAHFPDSPDSRVFITNAYVIRSFYNSKYCGRMEEVLDFVAESINYWVKDV